MAYNNRHRPSPQRKAEEPNLLDTVVNAVQDFTSTKHMADKAVNFVKPANRGIIGLVGLIAVGYWIFTAKNK